MFPSKQKWHVRETGNVGRRDCAPPVKEATASEAEGRKGSTWGVHKKLMPPVAHLWTLKPDRPELESHFCDSLGM